MHHQTYTVAHTYTHISPHTPSHTHIHTVLCPHTPLPHSIASVRECPVPGRGVALQGVHVAAGEAAWRGGGADPGRGGGRVPGGAGSLVGKVGRRGSHPAEKTSPGDLKGKKRRKRFSSSMRGILLGFGSI